LQGILYEAVAIVAASVQCYEQRLSREAEAACIVSHKPHFSCRCAMNPATRNLCNRSRTVLHQLRLISALSPRFRLCTVPTSVASLPTSEFSMMAFRSSAYGPIMELDMMER